MKVIHLTAYGNPAQSLMMVEVSEPNAPSASEALVRMEYAPINFSDLLLANGVYFLNPKLPSVIGGEGAGIVEAIGSGVTHVKVGDRVTILFGTFTWSEKVLAPAQGLFVVPPSVDAKTASMLNINPTTAVLLLDVFVKLKAKDWIVLNAANSQVARCLIAIAKSRDLNVVGIVRRSEVIPEIEKLDVDFVGVESPELSKQIQIATGGMPIPLGLDALTEAATVVASGKLTLPITTTYKPSHIKEAIEHSQRGGKVLLDFNHTN
jgi:NADPH:quinone reductase-like Zn-dependent oxidoreductase